MIQTTEPFSSSRTIYFVSQGRPAEINIRGNRTVRLRLLQVFIKAIRGGITVKAKETGGVFDGTSIGKHQNGRRRDISKQGAKDYFHRGIEFKGAVCLKGAPFMSRAMAGWMRPAA